MLSFTFSSLVSGTNNNFCKLSCLTLYLVQLSALHCGVDSYLLKYFDTHMCFSNNNYIYELQCQQLCEKYELFSDI